MQLPPTPPPQASAHQSTTPLPTSSEDTPRHHQEHQTSSHLPDFTPRSYRPSPPTSAHHGPPTRPQSVILRDSQSYLYTNESHLDPRHNLTSQPRSSSSHLSPQPHSSQGQRYVSSPNPRRSPSHSIAPEDDKFDDYGRRPSAAEAVQFRSSPSGQPSLNQHDASRYAVSIASTENDGTPTTRQTVRSLLHLALTAFPLSLIFCIYTLFTLLFATILMPLRICSKASPSFSQRLLQLLIPPLNFQRRCIYQPAVATASSRSSSSSRTPLSSDENIQAPATYLVSASPAPVITTHLLAPLVALPIAICAWVMGTAWGLGAMVSDEEAGDDHDERGFAQRVVSWWAWWLNRGLEDEDVDAPRTGRGRRREMEQRRGV